MFPGSQRVALARRLHRLRASNADGLRRQQGATRAFPAGVLYAVHDGPAAAAFDWRDMARALQLRENRTMAGRARRCHVDDMPAG